MPATASKSAVSLQEIADYLTTGYWDDSGGRPRHFNLEDTGRNANDGVLHFNLSNTGGTVAYGEVDRNGIDQDLRSAVRDALDLYEEVLGITFLETVSTGGNVDLFFGDTGDGNYAKSRLPVLGKNPHIDHAYINLSGSSSGPGDTYFSTIIHEIGHTLGLGHAGPYNVSDTGDETYEDDAIFTNDSDLLSIMSYWSQDQNPNEIPNGAVPTTPAAADWLALDDIYGNQRYGIGNAFAGDTVYGVGTNLGGTTYGQFETLIATAEFTLVDSGGIDTVNVSNYQDDQIIRLSSSNAASPRPSLSDLAGGSENMSISVGTIVENAIAGGGDDVIHGNMVNNTLEGGGGNDKMLGHESNDELLGGAGKDTLEGGIGADTLEGGGGTDTIEGNAGADTFVYRDGQVDDTLVESGLGDDRILMTGTGSYDFSEVDIKSLEELEFGTAAGEIKKFIISEAQLDEVNEIDSEFDVYGNANGAGAPDNFVIHDNTPTGNPAPEIDLRLWSFSNWEPSDSIQINGSNSANDIFGSQQDDTISGGHGDDRLTGERGDDQLNGGAGSDHIQAWKGYDTLHGGNGADYLAGGPDSDTLYGSAGNDTLFGGERPDVLQGGPDNDTFRFLADSIAYVDDVDGGEGYDTILLEQDGSFDLTQLPVSDIDEIEFDESSIAGKKTLKLSTKDLPKESTFGGFGLVLMIDGNTGNQDIIKIEVADTELSDVVDLEGAMEFTTTLNGIPFNMGFRRSDSDQIIIEGRGVGQTNQEDDITGSSYGESIRGFAGADLLDGGAGGDTVEGGDGDDHIDQSIDFFGNERGRPAAGLQGLADRRLRGRGAKAGSSAHR